MPYSTIRETISSELGKPVDAVFESVDPVPLASASVAQVHAAVLRGSRKNVVIKVLKPDVADTLTADLSFIYIASRVLTFLNPELARLSLVEIVEDIRSSMMDEVDFTGEMRLHSVDIFYFFLFTTSAKFLSPAGTTFALLLI